MLQKFFGVKRFRHAVACLSFKNYIFIPIGLPLLSKYRKNNKKSDCKFF